MLQKAAEFCAEGVAFALVTVVRAVAPTSGKPGDKAILTERGEWLGWVGGSCAEPAARRAAQAALEDGECRLLQIVADGEEPARPGVERSTMTCYSGGSLELYVEPQLSSPSLVVFGASPIASAVAELGAGMGYRVQRVESGSADLSSLSKPGRTTFVVVASHGRGEDEALAWALSGRAGYVGLVTSRRRLEEVKQRLTARGVGSEDLVRLHAPAGLDIGAKGPREVALSVLAQIVAERRGARASLAASTGTPKSERAVAASVPAAVAPAAASPAASAAQKPVRRVASCCDPEPAAEEAPAREAPATGGTVFSAVVLAAGLSRRMGSPNKLLLSTFGEPMIVRVVRQVLGADFREVVLVLGHQADEVKAALAPLSSSAGASRLRMVLNDAYESGQVSSVRAGLGALREKCDAVMMCLGDQPLLTSDDLRELQRAFVQRPSGSIVVPVVGEQRGNPVVLDWQSATETLARGTNIGCRHFMDEHAERVYSWQASSDHFIRDIDQPAEYQALLLQMPA